MKNIFSYVVLAVLSTLFVAEGQSATSIDYVSLVDPRIETAVGRWFFSTPASRPFGMVKLTPHSINGGQGGGGYNWLHHRVLGFCHLHGWMTSGLEVMPTTGGKFSVDRGEEGWKSDFEPNSEIAKPGYHKLWLKKYSMWVELTTTSRVGMHRYTYTTEGKADIIINLSGHVGPMKMVNGRITKVSDTQLEGYYDRTEPRHGGPKAVRIFFVIKCNKPFSKFITYNNPENNSTSAYVTYDNVRAGDVLQMKVTLSFTSIANARANMDAELDHWDFDAVVNESFQVWNEWLGKIDVEGGTDAQRTKFYTDLWHVLLGRHVLNDVNGAYPDYTNGNGGNGPLKVRQLELDSNGKPKFNMYNSDAYWLSQWNLNLIWGMAWPQMLDEFANACLQMARDGRKLPRGPCGGGYTHIMTGCPATMLIVCTYMKELNSFDPEEAFAIIKDNHTFGGANMLDATAFYEKNGWLDGFHGRPAGRTVEMCFQDWCAAQMARKLGKTADYKHFLKRSSGWKNLFHPPTGLLMPKDVNGNFSPTNTDPLNGDAWVEANSWQASWFTSHDVQGLANLMGGLDEYCRKLNFAFEQEVENDFVHGYGSGYVSYANQPGCSNAHLFNYAGKPWLTQYWVRRINEQAYGGTTIHLGYGGHDEDQGQMAGVSALMSIGLFSIRGTCGTEPIYEITSPVFDKITITLDEKYYSGKQFVISTKNNSAVNDYIQSVKLDGKPLNNNWFYHRDFADGGTLEIELGPKPNYNWGVAQLPPSESSPDLAVRVTPPLADLRLPVNSIRLAAMVNGKHEDATEQSRTVKWELLKGDGKAEFSNPDRTDTWVSFDCPGAYTLQTTITDGQEMGVRRVYINVLERLDMDGPNFDDWIGGYNNILPEKRGADQDPDGDGMVNLIEKLFDGDPANAEAKPKLFRNKKGWRLRFKKGNNLRAGSFYTLEYRSAAGNGNWMLMPEVKFNQIESLESATLIDAVLPGWLEDIRPVDIRLSVSEPFDNRAAEAKVSVSSAYGHDFRATMAIDGTGQQRNGEWASAGESTPWIQLEWSEDITIRGVRFCDRPNMEDHTEAGTLTFSDGSSVKVTDIPNDSREKTVVFAPKTVCWVRFQVTGGIGPNLGLCEIEVFSGGEKTHFPVLTEIPAVTLSKIEERNNKILLNDSIQWLRQESHRIIRASERKMRDGTKAFPPQVGTGHEAFWLRDYAYTLEGNVEAYSTEELLASCRLFVKSMRADGSGVDCVLFDGKPIYKPGYGGLGKNPVTDGGPFTVVVAWETYQKTKDAKLLDEIIDSLVKTMLAVPRNPETSLVRIVPGNELDRCPYGFTDTIHKQGDVLFSSLLFVQASRQLTDLLNEQGRQEDAQEWLKQSKEVAKSIRQVFWDPKVGLFRAATVRCREHDIWGSAFAVYLDVADSKQAKSIANYFKTHYEEIVDQGHIRHIPGGQYWEIGCSREEYQNGGYWAVPTGWFVYTLDLVNPEMADKTIVDMVNYFKKHGVHEWINGQRRCLPHYLASVSLPLAGIEAMMNRRSELVQLEISGKNSQVINTGFNSVVHGN